MKTPDARARSTENLIKAQGYALGFDLVGIATAGPMDTTAAFDSWIESGYAGEMEYLPRGAAKRADSRLPFAGATSAIVVGLSYGGREPFGPIARYARGDDYHDVMTDKLEQMLRQMARDRARIGVVGAARIEAHDQVDGAAFVELLDRLCGYGRCGK